MAWSLIDNDSATANCGSVIEMDKDGCGKKVSRHGTRLPTCKDAGSLRCPRPQGQVGGVGCYTQNSAYAHRAAAAQSHAVAAWAPMRPHCAARLTRRADAAATHLEHIWAIASPATASSRQPNSTTHQVSSLSSTWHCSTPMVVYKHHCVLMLAPL